VGALVSCLAPPAEDRSEQEAANSAIGRRLLTQPRDSAPIMRLILSPA
jgi:hypothetical protein